MTCPDRYTLFAGLEEADTALAAHLEQCPSCRAAASAERALDGALDHLRDPAPPAELLLAVMRRVDEAAAHAQRARRQTLWVLAMATAVVVAAFLSSDPKHAVHSLLETLGSVSAARIAVVSLGRTLAPLLSKLAIPMIAAQALLLLGAALLFNRLLATGARSQG